MSSSSSRASPSPRHIDDKRAFPHRGALMMLAGTLWRLLIERLTTNGLIDFVQLVPALLLIAVRHPSEFAWWPALLLSMAAVLLIGNLTGAVASTLSDSPGEVMLYVVIPLIPLLYLSGVFTPLEPPILLVVSRLLPFSYLYDALLGALCGQPNLMPWVT